MAVDKRVKQKGYEKCAQEESANTTSRGPQTATKENTKSRGPQTAKKEQEVAAGGENELVGGGSDERNWRGIGISLLVIIIVCALIVTAVILVTPKNKDDEMGEKFTLDDYFLQDFKPKEFHAQFLDGEEAFVYRDNDGALLQYDCLTNSTQIIMDNTTFRQLDASVFHLSADREYVLLAHDIQHVYRHSRLSAYSLYYVNERKTNDVEGKEGTIFQYIGWSPKGHTFVYVQNNNLYYRPNLASMADDKLLSGGGESEVKFNGVPDWVYEEEILGSDNAIWWSKEGTHLCYAIFNDQNVVRYSYPYYGDPKDEYDTIRSILYPKPGSANPTFELKVVDMQSPTLETKALIPPAVMQAKEYYFMSVVWRDDSYVVVTWMTRAQNHSIITICSVSTGQCNVNLDEQSRRGWLEMTPPMFTPDGKYYFIILPVKDGSNGYYRHVAMIDSPTSSKKGDKLFVTHGSWDVTSISGYDVEDKYVYYIGTGGDSRRRHLYRANTDRGNTYTALECVSCNIDKMCQYVTAQFSSSGKYYILGCKGPGVPYYTLRSTQSDDVHMLENNEALREKLGKKALPIKEYIRIKLEDNSETWAQMYLPPILDKEEILTYKLLLNVYGGPGSQKVTEEFVINWETYLSSSRDFICAAIDGRGSGGQGEKFMHALYRNLGTVEVQDQITAAKVFDKLHFVDSDRKAIWGWSYGGFVSSSVLGEDTDAYKCGIAVAPVTDWRYYDSVYTERYMGLPTSDDNQAGYDRANVSHKAHHIKKSSFLLVHGTADDNVHFQNSAQLIRALTNANVFFRLQVYTDQQHSLNGGNTRHHLYETMEDFLLECFTGKSEKLDQRLQSTSKQEAIEQA